MIIAVINQKGGVAKTTSTLNIAAALSVKGKKVLMVDLDPQASLTISLGFNPKELKNTIYSVMCEGADIRNAILDIGDYSLLPSIIYLSVAEMRLINEFGRENILKKRMAAISDVYDYILIDCPPSLGLLTVNALCACNKILIPVSTDFLALLGMSLLFETIQNIKDNLNPTIEVLGIIPTMYNATKHAKEILDELNASYGSLVLEPVGVSVQVKDAILQGGAIVKVNPTHKIASTFLNIAEVIIHDEE